MSEEQQAQESQERTEGADQESTEQQQGQQQGESQDQESGEEQQGGEQSYDEAYVKKLREEAADYRTKLRNAEKRVSSLEKSQGKATEELSSENSTLKDENESLKRQVRRSHFIEDVNLPNADAAWAIAQDMSLEVEYDDNHRSTNLDAVRKALRERKPALFGNGSVDGGKTTNNGSGFDGAPGRDRLAFAYSQKG